jgi:hypothetical protein
MKCRIRPFIFGLLVTIIVGGCKRQEEAKTREQMKAEIKAEMKKELEKEQLKAEAAQEVAQEAMDDAQKKAVQAESRINLRKLYDSAVAYYSEEHANSKGEILPSQFPQSTPITPPKDCCSQPNGKCAAAPTNFESKTWEALNFSVDEPMTYRYLYTAQGTGASATFTARAIGDPGCTGKQEIWEVSAKGTPRQKMPYSTAATVKRVQQASSEAHTR